MTVDEREARSAKRAPRSQSRSQSRVRKRSSSLRAHVGTGTGTGLAFARSASRSIDICVFTITDDRITSEIMEAKKRGLALRIISDDDKANDLGSDVDRLASSGIPVRVDRTEHHMHHKFALFDRRILTTGSYNWTRSAEAFNHENLIVSDDERLVRPYLSTFEDLWHRLDPVRTA